jgi:hypothetical protein
MPVLMVVELGLGGLVFIGVLLGILWFKIPNKSQIQKPPYHYVLPLSVCWAVLIMLDHYLWTLPAGLYLTGLVVWAGRGLDRG